MDLNHEHVTAKRRKKEDSESEKGPRATLRSYDCDHLEAMIEKNDLTYYHVLISLSDLVAHHLTLLIHFNHLTTDDMSDKR